MAGLYLGAAAVELGGTARLMLGGEQIWPVATPARAVPVFRSATASTVSTTIARPAGVLAGDLLIGAFIDYEAAAGNITIPSGWTGIGTILRNTSGGATTLLRMGYKVATGAEPASYNWGTTSGDYPNAMIVAYQSCDTSDPIADIQVAQGNNTARQLPAATVLNDNSARIGVSAGYGTAAAVPAGMFQRISAAFETNAIFDLIPVSAGAVGALSADTNFLWIGATLVINGAPS